MSRSLVGSSSTSTSLGWSMMRAMWTRASSPPLSEATGWSSWVSWKRKRRAHPVTWMDWPRKLTWSPAGQSASRSGRAGSKSCRIWLSVTMIGLGSARSTEPASGGRSPVRMRMSVVLPLPFGPRSPRRSPAPSTRSMFSNKREPPSDFETPLATTILRVLRVPALNSTRDPPSSAALARCFNSASSSMRA